MPDQHTFHQYLRSLAQSAVRTVLETVMREELDAFIGVKIGHEPRYSTNNNDGTHAEWTRGDAQGSSAPGQARLLFADG